ncbi:MAG: hypothetical protein KDA62_20290 [Planctomycetales bacterium]|nr:hypothetical protein [Planctomycetales bacterium]MCB9925903.1 hypothetical protein [Planctomycetaceae bacterium]
MTTQRDKGTRSRPRFGLLPFFTFVAIAAVTCYLPRLRFDLERQYEDDYTTKAQEMVGVEGARIATKVELNHFFDFSEVRMSISIPRSHLMRLWRAKHLEGGTASNDELREMEIEEIFRIERSVFPFLPTRWYQDDDDYDDIYPIVSATFFDAGNEEGARIADTP